ncbi:MAG: CAP domain-containing protein [Planctomycetota bacterium]
MQLTPVLLAAALALPGLPTIAQEEEPPTERELIALHVRTLRSSKLALNDKLDALETLLELGTEGPRRAAGELDKILDKERKSYEKDRARALRDAGKRAVKLIDARLDRKGTEARDAARRTLLATSRSQSLTKDEVRSVCDPEIERLRALLRVDRGQIEAVDPELGATLADLESRASDAALMADYFVRAREVLARGDRAARRAAERRELPWDAEGAVGALTKDLEFTLWTSPLSDGERRVLEKNVELAAQVQPMEAEGNRLLNDLRLLAGLNPCLTDPKLCAAGRDHSKDMKELDFFSHDSPVDGKETFSKRAANFGASAHAENIAWGQSDAAAAIEAWWYSPGHHRNMMGGHARVGLGRFETHWTQLFGG